MKINLSIIEKYSRLSAKTLSIIFVAFVLFMIIGHIVYPDGLVPTGMEAIGMLFFPVGMLGGLIIAWRREGLGATISILSFLIFYLWIYMLRGYFPRGYIFILFVLPAVLFLVSWMIAKKISPKPVTPAPKK